jgi:hypothetical protein
LLRGSFPDGDTIVVNVQGDEPLLEPALMQLRFVDEPLRPRFELEMVGADGKKQDKDRLSFAAGSVDSSSCRPFGFLRAAYTTTADGDGLRFEAVAASAEYGLNHWQGTVRGDRIEGTLKSGESADTPVLRFTGQRVP